MKCKSWGQHYCSFFFPVEQKYIISLFIELQMAFLTLLHLLFAGKPATSISCCSWATWQSPTLPSSHSGVKAAVSTVICMSQKPSLTQCVASMLPDRQLKAWSKAHTIRLYPLIALINETMQLLMTVKCSCCDVSSPSWIFFLVRDQFYRCFFSLCFSVTFMRRT